MRLNKIYKESLDENSILNELNTMFSSFKNEKSVDEHFGDFCLRKQWV
jgi:sulfite reductase (NADPH) hemoprotein beta-component